MTSKFKELKKMLTQPYNERVGPKRPNDVSCYAFGIGNLSLNPFMQKSNKILIDTLNNSYGFVGIHPMYPYGTLVIYKTEIDAQRGKRILNELGVECGEHIVEVFIDKGLVEHE